jgi:hypothetical protein
MAGEGKEDSSWELQRYHRPIQELLLFLYSVVGSLIQEGIIHRLIDQVWQRDNLRAQFGCYRWIDIRDVGSIG